MKDIKKQLRDYLERYHFGAANAITSRVLCMMFELEDWPLRELIRELITDGLPVASALGKPPGFFVVATRAEADIYALRLKDLVIANAIRRRDFRRAADQYLTPAVQLELVEA